MDNTRALTYALRGPLPSIIATKGHPFTRKTEFARTIASSLGCPVLSSEDFLGNQKPPLSPEKEFEAFKGVCNIAFHLLQNKTSKNVVIDSSLSSKAHLIQLQRLAHDLESMCLRVIIIECKPINDYSWKLKFDEHLSRRTHYRDQAWFKPKNWKDVEKARKDNPDYDIGKSAPDQVFVSKLVVDPLMDCATGFSDPSLNTYRARPSMVPGLVEAVKYMMTRDQGDGPDVVVYREWLQQPQNHSFSSIHPNDKDHCKRNGHDIVPNSAMVQETHLEVADCVACQKQVTWSENSTYCYCKNCDLALHMECAEAFDDHDQKKYVDFRIPYQITLPEQVACNQCGGRKQDFSVDCGNCLFKSHLKCRLLPTTIKQFYNNKEYFLTILLLPHNLIIYQVYRCAACGQDGSDNMYLCKERRVAYHYECVTMPRLVEDEHGGYDHIMSLRFESEKEEDYICQECHELRDPTLWFYSCTGEDCTGYELHPHCVRALEQSNPAVRGRHAYRLRRNGW